jgi:hypothetical protein
MAGFPALPDEGLRERAGQKAVTPGTSTAARAAR